MTTAPAQRRGSFLETWRLFSTGRSKAGLLLLLAGCLMPLLARTPTHFFFVVGATGGLLLGFPVLLFEEFNGQALVFLGFVPQPVQPKWLVLVPMCLTAVVGAVAMATWGRLSSVAALSLLGCSLWVIGATRWLRMIQFSVLFAFPLLASASAAAYCAYHVGGWGAAAAMSLALGFAALAFQPRVRIDIGREPLSPREPARGVADPRIAPVAASMPHPDRAPWLAASVRFRLLNLTIPRLKAVLFLMMLAVALLGQFSGSSLFVSLVIFPIVGLKDVYSTEADEFLRPRPFSKGQRFMAGVVFAVLPLLLFGAIMFCCINLDWINAGGGAGRIWSRGSEAFGEQAIRYLRETVGATFLPDKWPSGGLSPELWRGVRPLLYLDLLRNLLLIVAYLFAQSTPSGPIRGSGRLSWAVLTLMLIVPLCALRVSGDLDLVRRLPVPPPWFAALLAALAIANWIRARRFVVASIS